MNSDNNLEAYKIINTKLNQEVDEFYSTNRFFLAVLSGGLFGEVFLQSRGEEILLSLLTALLGLFVSIIWYEVDRKSILYRNWWVEKAKKFEEKILDSEMTIWREGECEELRKAAGGIWLLVKRVPLLFIIAWAILLCMSFSDLRSSLGL